MYGIILYEFLRIRFSIYNKCTKVFIELFLNESVSVKLRNRNNVFLYTLFIHKLCKLKNGEIYTDRIILLTKC